MLDCEGMKVSAVIIDKQNPDNLYLAEDDIVLLDPPISVTVSRKLLSVCLLNHLFSRLSQINAFGLLTICTL